MAPSAEHESGSTVKSNTETATETDPARPTVSLARCAAPASVTLLAVAALCVLVDTDLRSFPEAIRTAAAFLGDPSRLIAAGAAAITAGALHAALLVIIRRPRLRSDAGSVGLVAAFLIAPLIGASAAAALLIAFQLSGVWLNGSWQLTLGIVTLAAAVLAVVAFAIGDAKRAAEPDRTPELAVARLMRLPILIAGLGACVAVPFDIGARALSGPVFMPSFASIALVGLVALWLVARSVGARARSLNECRAQWRRERCGACGYPVVALESTICPECGGSVSPIFTADTRPESDTLKTTDSVA